MLSKLFPSTQEVPAKPKAVTIFDPTAPQVNFHLKQKKKSGSVRVKSYKHWVIVLNSETGSVPTANGKRRLIREGRQRRVEFKRTMSPLQVKNVIIRAFPELRMTNATFWQCDNTSTLNQAEIEEGFPDREELLEISSKESVYLVEGEAVYVHAALHDPRDCAPCHYIHEVSCCT